MTKDNIPYPKAAHTIKFAFWLVEISNPYWAGIDKNNGNIDDKLAPKAIALKLHAYEIYPKDINPKDAAENIICPKSKTYNFLDGVKGIHEDKNLKIVIDIQKIEANLVAFYFVLIFERTA